MFASFPDRVARMIAINPTGRLPVLARVSCMAGVSVLVAILRESFEARGDSQFSKRSWVTLSLVGDR